MIGASPVARVLVFGLWLLAPGISGCVEDPDPLATLFPHLDATVLRELQGEDGSAFARFAVASSSDRLISARDTIVDRLFSDPPLSPGELHPAHSALDALDRGLADGHGLTAYTRETAVLRQLPLDRAFEVIRLRKQLSTVFSDTLLEHEEKRVQIEAAIPALEDLGYTRGVLKALHLSSLLSHRLREGERSIASHRRATELGLREGFLVEETVSRGQLMMYKMDRGWSKADRDTVRWMLERNQQARHAGGSSQALQFQAYDAHNQGHYSTARLLFQDSVAICHEYGEPAAAMSTYETMLNYYAALECWNQVDSLIDRLRQTQDESLERAGYNSRIELSRVRHAVLTARSLASRGESERSFDVFAEAFAKAESSPFAETEFLGQRWVESMVESERVDLAARADEAVTAAFEKSDEAGLLPRLPLWRAWIAWKRGDLDAARTSLREFETEGLAKQPKRTADLEYWFATTRARVEAPSDSTRAEELLQQAWQSLRERTLSGEPGPESYLDLARNSIVRHATHDLFGKTPEAGYGIELLWREGYPHTRRTVGGDSISSLRQAVRACARRAQSRLAELDATHCLFQIDRGRVRRWTVDARSVQCEVLEASAAALRERVTAVLSALGRDPGEEDAPVPIALAEQLAELARVLLPDRIFDAGQRPSTLLVSGEGFLAQLPIGPLNLGDGEDYRPLIESIDLGWLRRGLAADPAPHPRIASSLVVSDPALDASTRRRFQLPVSLHGAATELQAVLAVRPDARVLSGEAATETAVFGEWQQADLLYFIGHAVRDAEVPFTTWLPLASSSREEYPGLGLKDILSAQLDRCRLVVLSGCATGAPYVDGAATAPSLGDAFLDAGAGAALQTFWRVRDEGMAFAAFRSLGDSSEGEIDLIRAFSEECRRAMRGPQGIRHPFGWGAWSLKINS